jgi:four helix bundle protein
MTIGLESLNIYKQAKDLEKRVYELCKSFPPEERFGKTSQLKRSTSSVADNIAESYGRYGFQEKIHFLQIARGSSEEAKSQLDRSRIICNKENEITALIEDFTTEIKQINSYINYLRNKKSPINQLTN